MKFRIRKRSAKLNGGACKFSQSAVFLALAHNAKFPAKHIARRDGQIHPLVIHHLSDSKVVVCDLFRQVTGLDVYGRIHDRALSSIVLTNSCSHTVGIGDKIIDAVRRSSVPQTQVMRSKSEQWPRAESQRCSILVSMIKVPQIAHRRVAIAHMAGVCGSQYPFGWPGFRTKNEVVTAQVKLLQCQRV